MAHNVLKLDRGISKGAPWHLVQTRDRWTVADGLLTPDAAARIAWARQDGQEGIWDPMTVPVYAADGDGGHVKIPDSWHVTRNDLPTNDPARFISPGRGVGKQFVPITNQDIVDYCNALTDRGAFVDSAGSLFNGQRVFMSLFLPEGADIIDEQAGQHLLLTTAHDGTACFEALVAVVMTVCWNTLSWNRNRATTKYKIRHTHNATQRLAEADKIIKVASANFADTLTIYRNMALKKLSDDAARAFIEQVVGDGKRSKTAKERIMDLYKGAQIGADRESRKDTLFGLVNAAGQWIETDMVIRRHRGPDGEQHDESDVRAQSVLFGAGARKRDQVLNAALAML